MPHKDMEDFSVEAFLQAINIQFDAEYPERIAHYQPTAKSVPLLKSLLGEEKERSFLVVAPYGSGKSITATYLLQLVENRTQAAPTLEIVADKLEKVSPELCQFASTRIKKKASRGLVLTLQGYCPSVAESLKSALLESMSRLQLKAKSTALSKMPCSNIEEAIEFLTLARRKAQDLGLDRITIIWDEFGRHIETLIAEGRHSSLAEIQLIAEFVSRSKRVPITFGLLLHQELLQYASNLPQSVRTEWRKVEGRFRTIQYVDNSKEIYRLIAEVSSNQRSGIKISANKAKQAARECKEVGLFSDFSTNELSDILSLAYPMEPVSLYLLPRLSGRVAQNERTLFSFLNQADFDNLITPDKLYDYFSHEMRTDTSVGGTYRQWLETQSALLKIEEDDPLKIKLLKIASLLGFGISGERSSTSRNLLTFALKGYGEGKEDNNTINQLIEQKLLLHRRHSDEVSVWHGTDVDLRGRLEEEKSKQRRDFNFLEFLTDESPPKLWRPLMHNSKYGVTRYLSGEYQNVEQMLDGVLVNIDIGCDGKIVYVVAETHEEIAKAQKSLKEKLRDERVIVAVPSEPVPLFEAALEVWCLLQMQQDDELIGSDPMIISEILQLTDDARDHLQKLIDRLNLPRVGGPRWYYRGKELKIGSAGDLRNSLSDISSKIFHLTPKINNEMIIRKKPAPIVVNARKKLLLGILERNGQENLGIKGNFPDASMLRTVLVHTGLYHFKNGQVWSYASPADVEDLGLQSVWEEIQDFFLVPSKEPKDIRDFLEKLQEPPFGIRAGVIPILFAAGLKAFPSAFSLRKLGNYVTDILPSEIEEICQEPDIFEFRVLDLDSASVKYLKSIYELFSLDPTKKIDGNDLIRACYDVLESWKANLAPGALLTKRISEKARNFQVVIREQTDPVSLLLETIPKVMESSISQPKKLLQEVANCQKELSQVADDYLEQAIKILSRALAVDWKDEYNSIQELSQYWASCFPAQLKENLNDSVSTGLLSIMRLSYASDLKFIDSLSSLLIGRTLNRWDDSCIATFDREIHNVISRVEEAALSLEVKVSGAVKNGLANLVQGRMNELFSRLTDIVGNKEAQELFIQVLENQSSKTREVHGNR
jgi:hypothetical protein